MGAKKTFDKGWANEASLVVPRKTRMANLFENKEITQPSDLPVLLTTNEVAQHLKMNRKTASALMLDGTIRSMKLRGRRVSTPEWVAEFMRKELARNG